MEVTARKVVAVSGDSGGGSGLRVGARVVGLAVASDGRGVGGEVNPTAVGLSVVGDALGATVATAPCRSQWFKSSYDLNDLGTLSNIVGMGVEWGNDKVILSHALSLLSGLYRSSASQTHVRP